MLYISLIALIIGIILSIKSLIRKQSEVGVLQMLFTTSITIITSSFPNFWNNIIAIIALLKNQPDIVYNSLEFNYISFIFGIILLIFCLIIYIKNLKKIKILNINGYGKYNIENYLNNQKDIYTYKENEINFIDIYNKIFKKKLDDESCECILNQIEENIKAFRNQTVENKKGYTGIAPIPFIVYAGTFLNRFSIDKYYEYNKSDMSYYELHSDKKEVLPNLELKTNIDLLDVSKKEVTLVISLTQKIKDDDIKQFLNKSNIVKLEAEKCTDNVIKNKNQLYNYVEIVFKNIIDLSEKLGNLSRINLVMSVQSCFAIEVGKRCTDDTRLPQIISYQYENQKNIKYPWGIVINGNNKKTLVKEV